MHNWPYHPILEILRQNITESLHFGAIAVVNAQGQLVAQYGDPAVVTYTRSAAKPLQALPFLERGGQACFGLSAPEVAVLCASHSGSDAHVALIRSIQAKAGISEAQLLCGVHPLSEPDSLEALRLRAEAPTQNRNNCSGKHTGMLAYARLLAQDASSEIQTLTYIDPVHPVQQNILRAMGEMADLPIAAIHVGIDGCSAPNFALPLYNAALAFARLCDPSGLPPARAEACLTVTAAMTTHPEMIGGTRSFDTRLMQAAQGRLIAKTGAEGYQALGLLPGALGPGSPALGIAFKISDGDLGNHSRPLGEHLGRVRPAVALEILRQLGALSAKELAVLPEYGPTFPIYNWRKLEVGQARPCFELLKVGG